MSDKVINIADYLEREGGSAAVAGTMALWGAEGERSRFALPLWRIVRLAQAERGVIFWTERPNASTLQPFVAVDLSHDPARIAVERPWLAPCEDPTAGDLRDLGSDGLIVSLGARDGRTWYLLADGGADRESELDARKREDVLFLAGECAGLLFLRDFADFVDDAVDE
ncbi:MAG TPA: hypothetical protein VLA09_13130 [Longimicrobiales bacterium]|nr:hypothetical protein [Longimicrobiales bacterium]